MTIQEYQNLLNKKKVSNSANSTNTLSVIGDELLRHITGPASYKRSKIQQFLENNSVEHENLNTTIDTFKKSIRQ